MGKNSNAKKISRPSPQGLQAGEAPVRTDPRVHVVSSRDPRDLSVFRSEEGGTAVTRSTTSNHWVP